MTIDIQHLGQDLVLNHLFKKWELFTILTAPKDYETMFLCERAAIFALFHLIQERTFNRSLSRPFPKGPTYFNFIFEKFIRFLQKIKTASKASEFVFAGQRPNNFLP